MNNEYLTTIIDHLDSNSFFELIYYLLKQDDNYAMCNKLGEIDNRIIENPPERFNQTAEAFLSITIHIQYIEILVLQI